MLDTMGVILTQSDNCDLGELTRVRSIAAIPFAGRYRLVDFVLSSMVNSGITNVGVATDYNYQSLLDHLGSGKPWGLARKEYGLRFLPPFMGHDDITESKMRMLFDVLHFLKRSKQPYVIIADCNNVCNLRFDDIVAQHKESGAQLTIVYRPVLACDFGIAISVNDNGGVDSLVDCRGIQGTVNKTVGYYVFTKDALIDVLEKCIALGKKQFIGDVLAPFINSGRAMGYCYDGYVERIHDINSYYKVSMDLMDSYVRKSLFIADNHILTKVKDKVPTRYGNGAVVKNSMIADGCVINGTVENCILFRGVTVEKGAHVKDSIIMQETNVGENVRLSAVIVDKDCVIRKGKELVGQPEFPIIVGKRRTI
ncbi:MAG: glucose-1-phosphate adenylyltransferase subunit GlgD [Clostridia bacterium]|nr:glucose-1-phosphate adenylyltransferase subunit GlgD [Clostridia bacterium]MBQ3041656.1 glucose-1-phosphate adenylyltransferase subunit GlgD [Clostridia bacterium]MBQ8872834.1 glucose-1-phosphate adenylyltransferase subunit GlgD [Clostridia bacterium]MBQ9707465.1 glucose-1-phosphate adenylyltransferase subunit GlgD [Clostridia bacterium]